MRIDFRGYAADCIVNGRIELTAVRLSDMLGHAEHITVEDAVLDSLDGTRSGPTGVLVLQRNELYAVNAGPGSGDPERRVRTVRHMLRLGAGPYVFYGDMHSRPGADPLQFFHVRRGIVPLTNCHVLIHSAGGDTVEKADVILINAELVDALGETTTAEMNAALEGNNRTAFSAATDTSLRIAEPAGLA
jgi:hypothetical protein